MWGVQTRENKASVTGAGAAVTSSGLKIAKSHECSVNNSSEAEGLRRDSNHLQTHRIHGNVLETAGRIFPSKDPHLVPHLKNTGHRAVLIFVPLLIYVCAR